MNGCIKLWTNGCGDTNEKCCVTLIFGQYRHIKRGGSLWKRMSVQQLTNLQSK